MGERAGDEEVEEARREIERLRPICEGLKRGAFERGRYPRLRAEEVGREWREGDEKMCRSTRSTQDYVSIL